MNSAARLDGNEIWEWLFGELKGAVPDQLAPDLLSRLAAHINEHFVASTAPPVIEGGGELLPCPFCGSPAHVFEQRGGLWACCIREDCGAEVQGSTDRTEAIAAWNRRAHPSLALPAVAGWQPKDALQRHLKSKGATKLDPAIMDEYLREMNEVAIPAMEASQREQARINADPAVRFRPLFGSGVSGAETVWRDIFAEITAKATPYEHAEENPGRITAYIVPAGPIHRAAGKSGFQFFGGEQAALMWQTRAEAAEARLAALPVAGWQDAIEAAAKVAENWLKANGPMGPAHNAGMRHAAEFIASDIRALSPPK